VRKSPGPNCTTLRRLYDEVTVDDIREASSEAKQFAKLALIATKRLRGAKN
jgi:hypothetical protein